MPIARPDHADQTPETLAFQPIRVLDMELSQPLMSIPAMDAQTGTRYRQARVLVRLHTVPLGVVELPLGEDGLDAGGCADRIWEALHQEINVHLGQDGLPPVTGLDEAGIPTPGVAPCVALRIQALADAPFISVVVCTRDRAEQLANSLAALLALDYPRYEIIVVDNASQTSATAELIADQYGHLAHVRYVREDRPGLSWARNCGLGHVQGQIVAYMDDDEIPDAHWLAGLAEGFQVVDNVACVTGLIVPAQIDTQAQEWLEQFGGQSKGKGFDRLIFDKDFRCRSEFPLYPYFPSLGSGGNMAFKTSILRSLGGFDPALGAGTVAQGAEDSDAFFRVVANGYTLVYQPAALVRHAHGRAIGGLRGRIRGYGVTITAFLTKCLLDDPRRSWQLARLLPNALRYLLSSRSPRYSRMQASYPRELKRAEIVGMLQGPLAYLRSRRHTAHLVRQSRLVEAQR